MPTTSLDDPHERGARAPRARAALAAPRSSIILPPAFTLGEVPPGDARLRARLDDWRRDAAALLAGPLHPASRLRLEDSTRILGELARVLAGEEPGEGRAAERRVTVAFAAGRAQGVCAWIPCRRAVFVELLATAPWNLARGVHGEPLDPRAAPGAGRALLAHASRVSRALGAGGRVALQSENPRSAAWYARLGFAPILASDAPLALVPEGERGFSPAVLRLARGAPGPEEARAPWLLLDPERRALARLAA